MTQEYTWKNFGLRSQKLEARSNDSGYIFVDAAGVGRILMLCIRIHAYGTIEPSRSDSLAEITNSM